jgi:hypothetical protein
MTNPRRDKAGLQPGEVGKAKSNLSTDHSRPDAPLQSQIVEIVTDKKEPQIDSRTIAGFLGVKHRSTFALIQDFKTDFEQLGKVRFKTEALVLVDDPFVSAYEQTESSYEKASNGY